MLKESENFCTQTNAVFRGGGHFEDNVHDLELESVADAVWFVDESGTAITTTVSAYQKGIKKPVAQHNVIIHASLGTSLEAMKKKLLKEYYVKTGCNVDEAQPCLRPTTTTSCIKYQCPSALLDPTTIQQFPKMLTLSKYHDFCSH